MVEGDTNLYHEIASEKKKKRDVAQLTGYERHVRRQKDCNSSDGK